MNSEQFPAPRCGANRSPALSFINLTLLLTCTLAFAVATARMTGIDPKVRHGWGEYWPSDEKFPAVLQLTGSDLVYWDTIPMPETDIPRRLREWAKDPRNDGLVITGTDEAKLGTVVAAMDEANRAGVRYTVETYYRAEGR